MSILLSVLFLAHGLNGLPLFGRQAPISLNPSFSTRDTGDCVAQRSLWTIVWSCLVTIFACTWTAVHPNIPGPTDSGWARLKRRIVVMIYAMIAPEMIATWAMRQYFGARLIMNDYNDTFATTPRPTQNSILQLIKEFFTGPPPSEPGVVRPWTTSQAFFVQMGGIILCEDGVPVQVLDYPRLKSHIQKKTIDIPRITSAEVQDRSKGDFISKGVVIVHTTWFVVECIARWRENLPLSELEVVTLGFALLNAITYGLWWNKPQNVMTAILIESKISTEPEANVQAPQPTDATDETPVDQSDEKTQFISEVKEPTEHTIEVFERPVQKKTLNEHPSLIDRVSRKPPQFFRSKWTSWIWYSLVTTPLGIIATLLHPFIKMMHVENEIRSGALRVPMFYSGHVSPENELQVVQIVAPGIAGALFGAVHLIPWSFKFASRTEQILWRVSALVTLIEPLAIVVSHALDQHLSGTRYPRLVYIMLIPTVFVLPFYFVARFVLMTEAFLTLRNLPSAVFQNIAWTTAIPHFQT
ncbi:hypothetical protein HYPSUDRAFT_56768 [Hypholoma sublateritium FD-334 SS-4]|uniref:Uncharacterized protein n=1 Tax=Hypholoma sublateritium (strain FD-334 SS-4) TaxID=945553 RepID=A0A0D2KXI1_HYPSF|nr:hypothetical protein HYPSUDRAFT_56768 [Hypholoma sublateritium FD-334 SS-4]